MRLYKRSHSVFDIVYNICNNVIVMTLRASYSTTELTGLLRERFGSKLLSVVLFGSVARGTAREDSDIDVLIIHDDKRISHREFRDEFLRLRRKLTESHQGTTTHNGAAPPPLISSLIMSRSEVEATPYVLLDIVEDGIIIFDPDGFFANTKARISAKLRELGSKRIFLEDGTWYWNLKPSAKFNEIITI